MLRMWVLLLLLANGLYAAWRLGALAPLGLAPATVGEPETLARQKHPEAIVLRAPGGASSAVGPAVAVVEPAPEAPPAEGPPEEPRACWELRGLSDDQAQKLTQGLVSLGWSEDDWRLVEFKLPGRWVVYMGPLGGEALAAKKAELRRLQVDYRDVNVRPLGPGLALGTFSSEAAAEQAVLDLRPKGVRTARVAQERPESTSLALRLPSVTEARRDLVDGLAQRPADKSWLACEGG